MLFVKAVHAAAAVAAVVAPKDLDTESAYSVRNVAATIAHGAMSYYKGNTSAPNSVDVGNAPKPYYWWVGGALWGAMLDYYHYTRDPSYNDVVIQALLAPSNLAPSFDYMPKEHAHEEGNDDLFFWGSAVLAAAERNLAQPSADVPPWIDIAANVFNSLVSRWATDTCGGGLLWQIFRENPNGLTYKNSVSNGGLFQLAARLARATGNDTYAAWALKVWDWSAGIGLVGAKNWHVYDGVDINDDCRRVNKASFTYTSGIYLYGAAVMANHTGDRLWADRADRLLDGAAWFFKDAGATKVMYEAACETVDRCNSDMVTFKGYLSRYMWQAAVLLPSLRAKVAGFLVPSAKAAAAACTGGKDGHQCGMRWYTGGFDNQPGLGPQMCALEVIQGLLAHDAPPPLEANDIRHVREAVWKPVDAYGADLDQTTKGAGPGQTSKTADLGQTSKPVDISQTSKTADLGQTSKKADLSQTSKTADPSQKSKTADPSQKSKTVDMSQTSKRAEFSRTSERAELPTPAPEATESPAEESGAALWSRVDAAATLPLGLATALGAWALV